MVMMDEEDDDGTDNNITITLFALVNLYIIDWKYKIKSIYF